MKLNLEPQYIDDYWKLKNVEFAQFLQHVSSFEKWTLTGNNIFQDKLDIFTKVAANWNTTDYSKNIDNILELMSYMNIAQFAYLFSYIDESFPGLTIHYVLECDSNIHCETSQLLLKRLQMINDSSFLINMLTPLRTRLVQEYLREQTTNF